jgi:hypothetical protein
MLPGDRNVSNDTLPCPAPRERVRRKLRVRFSAVNRPSDWRGHYAAPIHTPRSNAIERPDAGTASQCDRHITAIKTNGRMRCGAANAQAVAEITSAPIRDISKIALGYPCSQPWMLNALCIGRRISACLMSGAAIGADDCAPLHPLSQPK